MVMWFTVVDSKKRIPHHEPGAYLVKDRWDDFHYRTLFKLCIAADGQLQEVGMVKIANLDMPEASEDHPVDTANLLAERFPSLGRRWFSLGQQDTYYERLRQMLPWVRDGILSSLGDVAHDPVRLAAARDSHVFRTSLMRTVQAPREIQRFARILSGAAPEKAFSWTYTPFRPDDESAPVLRFSTRPGQHVRTNVHALIGRNGVGKSSLLRDLARQVAEGLVPTTTPGSRDTVALTNVVHVSFSAFDRHTPTRQESYELGYEYVGLVEASANATERERGVTKLKSHEDVAREFAQSYDVCLFGARKALWEAALCTLAYPAAGLDEMRDFLLTEAPGFPQGEERTFRVAHAFLDLSAGHRVALLTIAKLVEHATDRTLVLIDEPEAHLHPPMLAALLKAVSDLLAERNGMAIVATHSPVVLQEIPADCVYVLRRHRHNLTADRPDMNTYGENIGRLTRDVFHLEVDQTGYYKTLRDLVNAGLSYEDVSDAFRDGLGAEARLLVRTLISARDRSGDR